MRYFISYVLITFFCISAYAQDDIMSDKNVRKVVRDFIAAIKSNNKEELMHHVSFPFERQNPVPDIKTKQEFLKKYAEVFDDSLVRIISMSDPIKDWSAVGWRGIMLLEGEVWLDYDGRLIAVNYQSAAEAKVKAALTKRDRSKVHESISKFIAPEYILETQKFRVRIDQVSDTLYRYASWPINKKMSEQPDLVVYGTLDYDGSGVTITTLLRTMNTPTNAA